MADLVTVRMPVVGGWHPDTALAGVLGWLNRVPAWVVLALAALLIIVEAGLLIGVITPGASAVLVLGVLAHEGVVTPVWAAITAAVAAVAGTQLGFWRGSRRSAPPPRALRGSLERTVELYRRAGPAAVCLCQWTVGARTLSPRLARHAGMPYAIFTRYSAPTAAVWGATLAMVGTLAEEMADSIMRWLGYGPATGLAAVVGITWWRLRRRERRP